MSAERRRNVSLVVGFKHDCRPPIVVTFYVDGQYKAAPKEAEERVRMQIRSQLPEGWSMGEVDPYCISMLALNLGIFADEFSKPPEGGQRKSE